MSKRKLMLLIVAAVALLLISVAVYFLSQRTTDNNADNPVVLSENTSVPSESTSVPSESTNVPSESTSVPSESTSVPSESTSVPSKNTNARSGNTNSPSDNTNTPYSVEYYYQNLNDEYDKDSDVLLLRGTPLSNVTAPSRDTVGFTKENRQTESGIIAENGSLVLKVYYSRNIRVISFDTAGGSEITPVSYKYGQPTTMPVNPVKVGYTFVKWQLNGSDYDFTTMPDENVKLTALWAPNTDTKYTVEYYLRNDSTDTYKIDDSLTEIRQGTTDTEVTLTPTTLLQYKFDASDSITSGIVSSDGSLTFKLFYTKYLYALTLDKTFGGTVTGGGLYRDASSVSITATEGLGHIFDGWYDSEDSLLSKSLTYNLTTTSQDTTVTAKFTQETGYGDVLTNEQFTDLETNIRKCVAAAEALAKEQKGTMTRITAEAILERANVSTGTVSHICVDFENGTLLSLNYADFGVIVVYTSTPEPTYQCVRKIWQEGTKFEIGDIMVTNGYIFKCIRAHVTGTTTRTRNPSTRSNKSTWEVVGYTELECPYSSTVRYSYCFTVIYNEKYYMRTEFNLVGGQVPYEEDDSDYWIYLPWN